MTNTITELRGMADRIRTIWQGEYPDIRPELENDDGLHFHGKFSSVIGAIEELAVAIDEQERRAA